jgi:hypothetical protein
MLPKLRRMRDSLKSKELQISRQPKKQQPHVKLKKRDLLRLRQLRRQKLLA